MIHVFKRTEIVWWEKQRLKYNLHCIVSGLLLLAILYVISILNKRGIYFFFMLPMCFLYLFFLNICFTVLWITYSILISKQVISVDQNLKQRLFTFKLFVLFTYLLNLFLAFLFFLEYKLY